MVLVCEYGSDAELADVLATLQGSLAASLITGDASDAQAPVAAGAPESQGGPSRRQRVAHGRGLQLGPTAWWAVAVDHGAVGHLGRSARPRPLRAPGRLPVGPRRMAASRGALGQPLGSAPQGRRPSASRRPATGHDASPRRRPGGRLQSGAGRSAGRRDPRRSRRDGHQGRAARARGRHPAWGPPWTATSSSYFESANRSKKSVELDLDDPDDLRLAQELAARCRRPRRELPDRAPRPPRPGLRAGAAGNPGVVYGSVTGFGSRGGAALPGLRLPGPGGRRPDEHHRDQVDEPIKAGVALVDVLTSKDAVTAILAALTPVSVPVVVSGSRSTCSPACSARSPTRRRPTWQRAKPRTHGQPAPVHRALRDVGGQGRAPRRVLRQRRPVPRAWRRSWATPGWRMTHDSRRTPPVSPTGTSWSGCSKSPSAPTRSMPGPNA